MDQFAGLLSDEPSELILPLSENVNEVGQLLVFGSQNLLGVRGLVVEETVVGGFQH